MNLIRRYLQAIAYPVFECENCLGMPEHSCYCAAVNASAPGEVATRRQRLALWLLGEKA